VDALQQQTDGLVSKLRGQPGLTGASTQFRSRTPQLFADIDRTKVTALGVSLQEVNETLGMYLGSLYVTSFNEFGRYWQVTIQAEGTYRKPGRGPEPAPGAEQVGADDPAGHPDQHARGRRPGLHHPL